jgi:hypothetical protein
MSRRGNSSELQDSLRRIATGAKPRQMLSTQGARRDLLEMDLLTGEREEYRSCDIPHEFANSRKRRWRTIDAADLP